MAKKGETSYAKFPHRETVDLLLEHCQRKGFLQKIMKCNYTQVEAEVLQCMNTADIARLCTHLFHCYNLAEATFLRYGQRDWSRPPSRRQQLRHADAHWVRVLQYDEYSTIILLNLPAYLPQVRGACAQGQNRGGLAEVLLLCAVPPGPDGLRAG